MRTRNLAVAATAAMALAVLTGCGGGGGGGGTASGDFDSDLSYLLTDDGVLEHAAQFKGDTITVMVPEPLNDWFADGTKAFEDATGTTVEYEVTPFDQLIGRYSTLAAGQDGSADVFYSWSAITAQMGPLLFEDLTDPVSDLAKQYTAGSLSSMQSGGRTYGLSYMTSLQVMYYNKALFADAGLDPEAAPKTWDDFVTAATALTGDGDYGFVTSGQTANDVFAGLWLPALNGAGGKMYSDDLRTATIDTDEGRAALEALAELGASGAVSPTTWSNNGSQDAAISFAAGNVGMTFNFPLAYPIVADPAQSKMSIDDLGVTLIPGVDLESGSVDGSEGLAISRYSENKQLALDFITYITGPTVQRDLATGDLKTIPSRVDLLADDDVVGAIPVAPYVSDQAAYPADRAGSPFYGDVAEAVGAIVRDVMQNGGDPAAGLTEMQDKVQSIVDQYWADNG